MGADSDKQVFLTALEAFPSTGPAVTFTGLMPDQHHYKGSFGGRVYPLWADAQASNQTCARTSCRRWPRLMARRSAPRISSPMSPPSWRIPPSPRASGRSRAARSARTADGGQGFSTKRLRSVAKSSGCTATASASSTRRRSAERPATPAEASAVHPRRWRHSGRARPLPETMDYDAAKRRLVIGKGFVENVTPAMRNYEISGKNVLDQWFSYRRRDRTKPMIGDKRPPSPLEKIQPDGWLAEYTEDLLNLLNVLGRLIALEPRQADLLDRIVAGPLSGPRRRTNRSWGQRRMSRRIRSRSDKIRTNSPPDEAARH